MENWETYIKNELRKEPGILLLSYPYTFLWKDKINKTKIEKIWKKQSFPKEKIVYIHIPFCKRKCTFCNFVAYFNASATIMKKYIRYLKKEMEITSRFTDSFGTISLCIGGGTPNILEEKELGSILEACHRFLKLDQESEMSIELLPDTSISDAKLKLLKDYSINRISLGIQTFDGKVKTACNRFDTSQQNVKIYNSARRIGFNNINFDLIFGLPKQNFESWKRTLILTTELGPEHISVYPFSARHSKILLYKYMKDISVKYLINTFDFTRQFLTQRGYIPISRHWYVKEKVGYKYNECYSESMPLLGLGLNSISYKANFTYKNTADLKKYFSALESDNLPIEKGYMFKEKDRMRNYIIRKITYFKIDRKEFKDNFDADIKYYFGKIIQLLIKFNLIRISRRYITLTTKGIFYTALIKRCFYPIKILKAKDEFFKNIY